MSKIILAITVILLIFGANSWSTVIHVPADYPTIQQGINACNENDTVMVSNGTYQENIYIDLPISLMGENRDSTIIDGSAAGDVIHIDTSYVFVSDFTITNGGLGVEDAGIELGYASYCLIEYCKFENSYSGVSMYGAAVNLISRCSFADNRYGIYFRELSSGPFLNNIANTVRNCIIATSDSYGVYFCHVFDSYHRDNLIAGNKIINNEMGVYSIMSQGNAFVFNQIESNNNYGIHHSRCICGGELNHFEYNNFISNNGGSVQAIDFGGGTDYWCAFQEGEGNFWSDYTGPDTNGNGIGDIPYDIDGGQEQDLFPFMLPLESGISGTVTDGSGPIVDVIVIAVGTGIGCHTNIYGDYSLEGLGAGMYDISFNHPFYHDVIEKGTPASLRNTTYLDVVMEPLSGIAESEADRPVEFALLQSYPNPSNAATTIRYSLPEKSEISLSIYNLLGQRVETLFEGVQGVGEYSLTWDASRFPSGIYFARLHIGNKSKNIKMVLLK